MLNLSNLFALLEPRGTSKKLSAATGISTGNISDWKSGKSKPTAEALVLVADYFSVSVDYLLGRSEMRDKEQKKEPVPGLSKNGAEMLELYEQLPEREQLIFLGRLHEAIARSVSAEVPPVSGARAV